MKERQCNVRRWLIAFVAAIVFVFAAADEGTAKAAEATAGWVQDGTGWRYLEEDGTYKSDEISKINGKNYYFGENSYMQTGWIESDDDVWYYADASGALVSGWQQIGGTWYYFWLNGRMAADAWVETDGVTYYVNASGAWVDASNVGKWILDGTGWWYRNADGSYPYDIVCAINGKMFGFDKNGYMVTGWYKPEGWGNWWYFDADGSGAEGWRQIDGVWYYFVDGYMLSGAWIGNYFVDENGACTTVDDGSKRIYENGYGYSHGYDYTTNTAQWVQDAIGWRYQYPNGYCKSDGIYFINGNWYCFDENGYMVTGWYNRYDEWFYFDASGAQVFGWQQIGGTWYYFNDFGFMLHDTMVDGYYLNGSGAWVTPPPSYAI